MTGFQIAMVVIGVAVLAWLYERWRAGRGQDPTRAPISGGEYLTPPSPWVKPGASVTVAGFVIPDGMIYVGSRLSRVAGGDKPDPALIDPALPVDRKHPDRQGDDLSPSPSYAALSPAGRAAFLEWLAGGRAAPEMPAGYVQLAFFAIERRVLHETADVRASGEWPALRREVERLEALYGGHRAFARRCREFLDVAVPLLQAAALEDLRPEALGDGVSPTTRLAVLGRFAASGRPLPPSWAFDWLTHQEDAPLSKTAERCLPELRTLFGLRYAATFGDGLRVAPSTTPLAVQYRPASRTFGGEIEIGLGVPDSTASAVALRPLRALFESCLTDLEALGRWLGRNPDGRQSPQAIALLPAELLTRETPAALRPLLDLATRITAGDVVGTIAGRMVLDVWPGAADGKLSKAEAVTLARVLESHGFGVVPDVRFGQPPLNAGMTAAMFKLPPNAPSAPTADFAAASLLVEMAAAVGAADGTVSPAELRHVEGHLALGLKLSRGEQPRLLAQLQWLAADPPKLSTIRRRASQIDASRRTDVARFLLDVAASDGQLERNEIALLEHAYAALGLPAEALHRDLHARTLGTETKAPTAGGLTLDTDVIAAKIRESAAASAILGQIFAEAEAAPPAPPPAPATTTIPGLDGRHATLFTQLAARTSWPRAEVDALCRALGLMPDGAIEILNDAAIERSGQPLCDGEDPIVVDAAVAREMQSCPTQS